MTLNVTVPDTVYRQIAELAARQQVSVERIVRRRWPNNSPAGAAWSKWPNAQSRAIPGRAGQSASSGTRPEDQF